jgi:hypothetical protein
MLSNTFQAGISVLQTRILLLTHASHTAALTYDHDFRELTEAAATGSTASRELALRLLVLAKVEANNLDACAKLTFGAASHH